MHHILIQAYNWTLIENGLLPLVTLHTQISNNLTTFIDHISTNINDSNLDTSIIVDSDVSDHLAVFFLRPFKNCRKVLPIKKVCVMDDQAKQKLISLLENQSVEKFHV